MPNNPATTKMNPADNSSGSRSDLVDYGDSLRALIRQQGTDGGIEAPSDRADPRDSFTDYGPALMQQVRTDNSVFTEPSAKPKAQ